MNTSPLVGCNRPSMIFISVVLPQPDGPMMVADLARPMAKLTFSRTKSSVSE